MKRLYGMVTILGTCIMIALFIHESTIIVNATATDIVIDGYYDDWVDKPTSFKNNPNIGKGKANQDNCHKMSLYRDRDYVYIHIIFSSNFYTGFYGEDYQIWVDGQLTTFNITFVGGSTATGNSDGLSEGNNTVEVRHAPSNTVATDSQAILTKTPYDINNGIELKIPLTSLVEQNPSLSIERIKKLEFYTPTLMTQTITSAGTSTAPFLGIAVCIVLVVGVTYLKHKREGNGIV